MSRLSNGPAQIAPKAVMTLLFRASEVSATKSPIEFAGAKINIPIIVFEISQKTPKAARMLTTEIVDK